MSACGNGKPQPDASLESLASRSQGWMGSVPDWLETRGNWRNFRPADGDTFLTGSFRSMQVIAMSNFPVHTLDTAPVASRASLEHLQQAFGMIPNIAGAMSTSPVLIGSLVALFQKVHGEGSFTEPQIQTVLLTDAVTNGCDWAVAFHTVLALDAGLTPEDVQAMREGGTPKGAEFAALSTLARTLIEKRGRLDDQDVGRFFAAGFSPELLLETITIVAASTITNYTASITRPPLDAPFQKHAWQRA
jgi:AhpD family alkylhydroperoxidase